MDNLLLSNIDIHVTLHKYYSIKMKYFKLQGKIIDIGDYVLKMIVHTDDINLKLGNDEYLLSLKAANSDIGPKCYGSFVYNIIDNLEEFQTFTYLYEIIKDFKNIRNFIELHLQFIIYEKFDIDCFNFINDNYIEYEKKIVLQDICDLIYKSIFVENFINIDIKLENFVVKKDNGRIKVRMIDFDPEYCLDVEKDHDMMYIMLIIQLLIHDYNPDFPKESIFYKNIKYYLLVVFYNKYFINFILNHDISDFMHEFKKQDLFFAYTELKDDFINDYLYNFHRNIPNLEDKFNKTEDLIFKRSGSKKLNNHIM